MQIRHIKKQLLTFYLGVAAAAAAQANGIWIESAGGGLQVQYGEPAIRVLEQSPAKLDAIALTRAGAARGGALLTWRKEGGTTALTRREGGPAMPDAFVEARTPAAGDAPARHFYARHAAWPLRSADPATTLDIVPTAEPNRFAIHYKGVPLTQGTLKVIAPSLWLQVHDIDERGRVRIATPWSGLYVLDVELREAATIHRATLSFTVADGPAFVDPMPAQYRLE